MNFMYKLKPNGKKILDYVPIFLLIIGGLIFLSWIFHIEIIRPFLIKIGIKNTYIIYCYSAVYYRKIIILSLVSTIIFSIILKKKVCCFWLIIIVGIILYILPYIIFVFSFR
jgi:hypothetical protein